ncbi:MAG: SDR family oxidoreductase, partial [Candidatus Thorarchaeota archaeon]
EAAEFLTRLEPTVVINCLAYTQVDEAQASVQAMPPDRRGTVAAINAVWPSVLASWSNTTKVPVIHLSTDFVFNGKKEDGPNLEDDPPLPINVYGQTKSDGEKHILASNHGYLVRLSHPFKHCATSCGHHTDILKAFLTGERRDTVPVVDRTISLTYVPFLAEYLVRFAEMLAYGGRPKHRTYHCASEFVYLPKFAYKLFARMGYNVSKIKEVLHEEDEWVTDGYIAERPKNSALGVTRYPGHPIDYQHPPLFECIEKATDKYTYSHWGS